MEHVEELEQRLHAFQARLGRFLVELGNLAPLQRRLVEDAGTIAVLFTRFGATQSSKQQSRHDAA